MVELIKIDTLDIIDTNYLDTNKEGKYYLLKNNDQIIGYGRINKNDSEDESKIELTIIKEYRGYGHGKKLFNMLMNELKNQNYKDIFIYVDQTNVRYIKILEGYRGLRIACYDGIVKYVVPIN